MARKADTNQPFMPFFVGSFQAATAEWEGEAVSLYATLLLHQWALGTLPADPKRICKLVRWDWDLFSAHWKTVRRKFHVVQVKNEDGELEDRLTNDRLESHRAKTLELSKKNSESGRRGAEKRWGKDGERHGANVANATDKDGERHSARHSGGDGERHAKPPVSPMARGNGNHPIPSHPIPSDPNPDISSQDSIVSGDQHETTGALNGHEKRNHDDSTIHEPGPDAKPNGVMAVALRKSGVVVTSEHPTLLQWIADGFTVDQLIEAVGIARIHKPREVIPANYLDRVVRNPPKAPAPLQSRQLSRWEQRKRALNDA